MYTYFRALSATIKRTSAFFLVVVFANAASATPIPVLNHNFEADPMVLDLRPTAYLNQATPAGWQSTGNALTGQYLTYSYSSNTGFASTVFSSFAGVGTLQNYNGQTLGFSSRLGVSDSGSMYQHTSAVIGANTGYELDVDVFNRWDLSGFTNSTFSFFAGNLSNTIKSWQFSTPREGLFNRQSFSVLADDLLAYQGLNLGISFTQISHSSLLIDNVALDSFYSAPTPPPPPVSVPAPAGGLALVIGLIGMCARRRIR